MAAAAMLAYSHVDMGRLKAALVDVVVGEGLCGVGAVLVHGDGHFALCRHSVGHPALQSQHQRNQQASALRHTAGILQELPPGWRKKQEKRRCPPPLSHHSALHVNRICITGGNRTGGRVI